jgi:hypothetical protein
VRGRERCDRVVRLSDCDCPSETESYPSLLRGRGRGCVEHVLLRGPVRIEISISISRYLDVESGKRKRKWGGMCRASQGGFLPSQIRWEMTRRDLDLSMPTYAGPSALSHVHELLASHPHISPALPVYVPLPTTCLFCPVGSCPARRDQEEWLNACLRAPQCHLPYSDEREWRALRGVDWWLLLPRH